MQVGSGDPARGADVADGLSLTDDLADPHRHRGLVGGHRGDATTVADQGVQAEGATAGDRDHLAGGRGQDRRAVRTADVDARVAGAVAVHRVDARADPLHQRAPGDRPDQVAGRYAAEPAGSALERLQSTPLDLERLVLGQDGGLLLRSGSDRTGPRGDERVDACLGRASPRRCRSRAFDRDRGLASLAVGLVQRLLRRNAGQGEIGPGRLKVGERSVLRARHRPHGLEPVGEVRRRGCGEDRGELGVRTLGVDRPGEIADLAVHVDDARLGVRHPLLGEDRTGGRTGRELGGCRLGGLGCRLGPLGGGDLGLGRGQLRARTFEGSGGVLHRLRGISKVV